MSATAGEILDRKKSLQAAFESIAALNERKRELSEDIKTVAEQTCMALGIAPKAFAAALKYYNLTDGERDDIDKAFDMTRACIGFDEQADLFPGDLEESLRKSVVSFERKHTTRSRPRADE